MTKNSNNEKENNRSDNIIEDKTIDPIQQDNKVDLICIQWYEKSNEGQQPKKAKICLNMNQATNDNNNNINNNNDLISKIKQSQQMLSKENNNDAMTNLGLAFKDFVSTHMTEPLKNYSIVVVKERNGASGSKTVLTETDITDQVQDKKKNIKEINIGEQTEVVVDKAEWAIKKTHQLSKEMVNSWQNGNTPDRWFQTIDYSNTLKILKDRAALMIDVAIGKYDKKDDKKNDNDSSKDKDN